jgi:hypothetical protein
MVITGCGLVRNVPLRNASLAANFHGKEARRKVLGASCLTQVFLLKRQKTVRDKGMASHNDAIVRGCGN